MSKIDDPIVALVVLDIQSENLTRRRMDTSVWQQSMKSDELYSQAWLLAYEAETKGWLPIANPNQGYVSSDPFFGILKNAAIEFYDFSRQVSIQGLKDIGAEMSGG